MGLIPGQIISPLLPLSEERWDHDNGIVTTMGPILRLPIGASYKKFVKIIDVHLGQTIPGKPLLMLLHAWVQVQAKLYTHYFLCK
jgi:hypothetical protein